MKRLLLPLLALPFLSVATTACNVFCDQNGCRDGLTVVVKEGGTQSESINGATTTVAVSSITGDSATVVANGRRSSLTIGHGFTVSGTKTRITLDKTDPAKHQATLELS